MIATSTYLYFDGNCREAMTFYGVCLQGKPGFTNHFEGPTDRVLHAELGVGPVVVMAADIIPGTPFHQGTNFSISLSCESLAEMERIFMALAEDGTVTLAMHDAFWGGRFGILTDKFGISWMLSFRDPGHHS